MYKVLGTRTGVWEGEETEEGSKAMLTYLEVQILVSCRERYHPLSCCSDWSSGGRIDGRVGGHLHSLRAGQRTFSVGQPHYPHNLWVEWHSVSYVES